MPADRRFDGCLEFDDRLLESAFAPSPDARLDAHLTSCARCRTARTRYLETADAIGGALAAAPPAARRRSRRPSLAIAAAVLVGAAIAAFLFVQRERGTSSVHVETRAGASVAQAAPGAWSISAGSATFEARRAPLAVTTPIGVLRTDDGRFTVTVEREREKKIVRAAAAAVVVTVSVGIGVVTWDTGDGGVTEVGSGKTAVHRAPEGASTVVARSPGGAAAPDPPPPAAPAEAAEAAPRSASVTGRVVDAETREPVARARVAAIAHASWGAPVLSETTSAADGTFRIEGFTSGFEAIRVESAEHAPFIGRHPFDAESVRAAHASAARGESVPPLDMGDVPLPRGVLVSGLVRREDGTPVADAAVLAFEGAVTGGLVLTDANEVGRSASDGRFTLEGRLGPSSFGSPLLAAVSPEGIGWSSIAVLAGRDAIDGVEIVIGACAEVAASVTDSAGRPVEGAVVAARPMFPPFGADYGPRGFSTDLHWLSPRADVRSIFVGTTDAEGRAVLPRLPVAGRGEYGFVASRGERTSGTPIHALVAGRRTELSFRLRDRGTIAVSGRVTSAATGEPIAGARVWTFEGDSGESDADGRYVIERMVRPTGAAVPRLNAAASGFAATMRSIGPLADVAEALEDVDFALERTAPVRGRVVDERGDPVARASVNLHRKGHAPLGATTGADGRFSFAEATEVEWGLRALPPEPYDEWRSMERPVVVRGGGPEAVVTLERRAPGRARLVAEIVDAASGAPVDPKSAEVVVVSTPHEPPNWASTTRETGLVRAERLRSGTWRLLVAATGGRMAWRDFTVEETADEVRIRVEVEAPGSIAGRVTPSPGAAGAQATATLRGPLVDLGSTAGDDVRAVSSALVGEDGSFRIGNLAPGPYLVTIGGDGTGVAGGTEAVVAAGEETIVAIAAERSGRVTFRTPSLPGETWVYLVVARTDGAAPPVAANRGVNPGEPLTHSIDARPGRLSWRVRFEMADHTGREAALPQEGEVDVEPGEAIEVTIPIAPPRSE